MAHMIMKTPATRWQDASPVGNGSIGAMMYGQLNADIVLLNHEGLFFPRKHGPLQDVSDLLPKVRELIEQGRYDEATGVMPWAQKVRGNDPDNAFYDFPDPYQPFCELRMQTSLGGAFRRYRRGVDFATGRAWVEWLDEGHPMLRELFVSRRSDTVLLRVRPDKAARVDYRFSLSRQHVAEGDDWYWFSKDRGVTRADCTQQAEPGGWIVFTGRFPGAWAFGAVAKVTAVGGTVGAEGAEVTVKGAREIVVRVKLFVNEEPESAIARLRGELQADAVGFDKALAASAKEHGELFNRMTLQIAGGKRGSNDEMLLAAYDGEVSAELIQTMFEYGRYLLICSSRPGGLPANLQGVWNGDLAPAWTCDYHNDENLQMNYWQALPGNLAETAGPFFDYFERYLADFRENARKLYGTAGILVPLCQSLDGRAYPCIWTNWVSAAGWLGQLFYDYFLFTGDKGFLARRAIPWLKEVALFYEGFLQKDSRGKLYFSPSVSPENGPAGMGMLTVNATMDVAVCREVLASLCDSCELLGLEAEGVARWRTMLADLPEYEINADGALREWLHPKFADNYWHRHQSHLYPFFPGLEITEETDPRLHEACRVAVEKRLVTGLTSHTGWSLSHMANIFARLGQTGRALECLELLIRGCAGPNLMLTAHDRRAMGLTIGGIGGSAPFQIDASLGFPAAILEMLAFSKPGLLRLLPALPKAWPTGRARGIACRGGITLDLDWDQSARTVPAVLTSRTDQTVQLKLPPGLKAALLGPKARPADASPLGKQYVSVDLLAGKSLRLRAEAGKRRP
ncbi:MAG: glycoside hydrolase N-terminal domain-containing protein [Planctomycetota bacterium]|nr:glycoside hydrolase N-terminal domain-containing protein [Planctomycetota bacterium]